MKKLFLKYLVPVLLGAVSAGAAVNNLEVEQVQKTAVQQLLEVQDQPGVSWSLPLTMGTNYAAQFALFQDWMRAQSPQGPFQKTQLDRPLIVQKLLQEQRPDGGWNSTVDLTKDQADLSASIVDYLFLKANGQTGSSVMKKAQSFILQQGGIAAANTFTRLFLALFGQDDWSAMPVIPEFLVDPNLTLLTNQFGLWIAPELRPLVYLRDHHVHQDLGLNYDLKELWLKGAKPSLDDAIDATDADDDFIRDLLGLQRSHGSWGGYTLSTMFTSIALEHYHQSRDFSESVDPDAWALNFSTKLLQSQSKANAYLDLMNIQSASPYAGSVCDGRYWDTALAVLALQASGQEVGDKVIQFLLDGQTAQGGFYFGYDFEDSPDYDDTAIILVALEQASRQHPIISAANLQKAAQFLIGKQNADGGWAAWAQNKGGNAFLRFLAKDFQDSADLFDPSSPDVTGHVLWALGGLGYNVQSSIPVQKAVAYLRAQIVNYPAWAGRWGVNYIYGTSAAVLGLLQVGIRADDPMIQTSIAWLKKKQNLDGGFGETSLADSDMKWAGVGVSTDSQTAWALMALQQVPGVDPMVIDKAISFLTQDFKLQKTWKDVSVTGTGHPQIAYVNYPIYPHVWPLMVVSKYLHQQKQPQH